MPLTETWRRIWTSKRRKPMNHGRWLFLVWDRACVLNISPVWLCVTWCDPEKYTEGFVRPVHIIAKGHTNSHFHRPHQLFCIKLNAFTVFVCCADDFRNVMVPALASTYSTQSLILLAGWCYCCQCRRCCCCCDSPYRSTYRLSILPSACVGVLHASPSPRSAPI